MAIFDTADLLAMVKRALNRPTSDAAFTVTVADDVHYGHMTDAQQRVYRLIAVHCPEALYGAPVLLTSADGGASYTFGTATGYPTNASTIFPIGHVEIRAARNGQVLYPGNDWSDAGSCYVPDGDKIRWPGGVTRVFSAGPYARFITPPGPIASAAEPTLEPAFARQLIVDDAVTRGAERLKMDSSLYEAKFQSDWAEILFALKTQFHGQGMQAHGGSRSAWWRGPFGFSR